MIRGLRLADVLLQLIPGRLSLKDLAVPRSAMVGKASMLTRAQVARRAATPNPNQHEIIAAEGGRLRAMIVLKCRSGPRSWEVAHLYCDGRLEEHLPGLLERSMGLVASKRGERLFLRVAKGTPAEGIAEGCGFRPLLVEDVYSMERPMVTDSDSHMLELRPPMPADAYGIFRLYNAAYPASARSGIGVTLDQWQDSVEQGVGKVREYLWTHEDTVRAWVRFDQVRHVLLIDAMVHPDQSREVPGLVAYVARLAWGHRQPVWIVPGHQHAVARTLIERGWARKETYTLMARTAATPVEEPALAAARA